MILRWFWPDSFRGRHSIRIFPELRLVNRFIHVAICYFRETEARSVFEPLKCNCRMRTLKPSAAETVAYGPAGAVFADMGRMQSMNKPIQKNRQIPSLPRIFKEIAW